MQAVTFKAAPRRGGVLMAALLWLMAGSAVVAALLLPLAQSAAPPAGQCQVVERSGSDDVQNRG